MKKNMFEGTSLCSQQYILFTAKGGIAYRPVTYYYYLEGLVDELPEVALQVGDPDVELHVVAVEAVVVEVQEVVALDLELLEDFAKMLAGV